jgi:hypothetical protein
MLLYREDERCDGVEVSLADCLLAVSDGVEQVALVGRDQLVDVAEVDLERQTITLLRIDIIWK